MRREGFGQWIAELFRFGFVGGMAYIIDTALFNLLIAGPGQLLGDHPITAKTVSAVIATLFAWVGNRYWAFARKRTANPRRELVQFILVNIGGIIIANLCLAVSHYLLGFTSLLADNIAANVVGLVLGTAFRYVCYKYWVFTADDDADPPSPASPAEAPRSDRAQSGDRSGTP